MFTVWDVDRVYDPEHFAKVSTVFGQHLKNLRANVECSANQCSQGKGKERYSWDNFTPRLIPLCELQKDEDSCGPWSRYFATPGPVDAARPSSEVDCVSNSMLLLLQLCSDVMDVEVRRLLWWVRHVEWTIIRTHGIACVLQSSPSPAHVSSADVSTDSDNQLSS